MPPYTCASSEGPGCTPHADVEPPRLGQWFLGTHTALIQTSRTFELIYDHLDKLEGLLSPLSHSRHLVLGASTAHWRCVAAHQGGDLGPDGRNEQLQVFPVVGHHRARHSRIVCCILEVGLQADGCIKSVD